MFFRKLTLLWKRFSPLEERLLSSVRSVLPAGAIAMFDAQVAAITRVQRLPPLWNEISFYRIKRGKPDWSGISLFPCTDEFCLAEIRFMVQSKPYKAALTSISGHIFDLTITPSPKHVAFSEWDAPPAVQLLDNPLRASVGAKAPEAIPTQWQNVRQRYGGESSCGWLLHDENSAHRVAFSDAEYLIVGEKEGVEYLLYRVESTADGLYYLEHDDGVPEPFRGRIESLLEGSG
jgi:hypothetical protein